jgi:Cu(I)/Ag(I) efflux system membrane fusion protein
MDPQVVEKNPGKCPICKMELTKTIISPNQDKEGIQLSETQIKLGNIKTQKVTEGMVGVGIQLRGTFVQDQRKVSIISSRVSGRIDKIYFKSPGQEIRVGDHVYDIYSESLQASVKQYLLLNEKAKEMDRGTINYKELLNAAKEKLIVWGMNEEQIKKLNPANKSEVIPFYSKVHGIVNEIKIKEGEYVNEGSSLVEVADLSSVWIEAEVYPQDLKAIHPGLKVNVIAEAYPKEIIEAKVSFENPELEVQSKITLVRIEIANKEKKYKPGMRVSVKTLSKEFSSIRIPEEAVLYQPEMDMVWVVNEKGFFSPKMVETGTKGNGEVEIRSGLEVGELLVISGAYLLDSEYRLRKGAGGIPGMDHGNNNQNEIPSHQH